MSLRSRLCSKMLLEKHLYSRRTSNSSATSAFPWEIMDFDLCNDYSWAMYLWASCSILCFSFGFPASLVILWDMFKTHRRGTPMTPCAFFIMNLSTMDAVFLAFMLIGVINFFGWQYWEIQIIWAILFPLNTCGRPLLMACICLDCYLAVVHPVTYHKKKSLTPRFLMAAIVWIVTLSSGISYLIYYKLFISFFSIWPFIVTIVVIGVCDSFILHALVKSDPGKKTIHPQKQKAVQTLINSLVVTVFSYVPPVLLVSIGTSLSSQVDILFCLISIPVSITSTSGSAIMPILHLINNRKLDCLWRRCCRKP